PPHAQPVAPMREHHCRRPRLPPRRCTALPPHRNQGHPGRRTRDPITSLFVVMRCPPDSPLFASWSWSLHTGCSLETIDMRILAGSLEGQTVGLYGVRALSDPYREDSCAALAYFSLLLKKPLAVFWSQTMSRSLSSFA